MKNFMLIFTMGWAIAPFVSFFEKYVFSDWQFAISLALIVFLDTLLGIVVALKLHRFSSVDFWPVVPKSLTYVVILFSTHIATTYKVNGEANAILSWLDSVVYAGIMVREMISIVENSGKLGFVFPAWILKRLKDFDEDGKFKDDAQKTQA